MLDARPASCVRYPLGFDPRGRDCAPGAFGTVHGPECDYHPENRRRMPASCLSGTYGRGCDPWEFGTLHGPECGYHPKNQGSKPDA
jgi:hypothetical protein